MVVLADARATLAVFLALERHRRDVQRVDARVMRLFVSAFVAHSISSQGGRMCYCFKSQSVSQSVSQ